MITNKFRATYSHFSFNGKWDKWFIWFHCLYCPVETLCYKLFYESLIKLKKIRRIKDRISIMAILQKVWNVRLYMHGCKRWVMLLTAFINIWKIIKWKEQKLQTVSIHFLLFIITSVKTNFKWSRGKHNIKKVEFPFDFMVIDCYVSPREMKEFGKKVRMLNVIWWNREIVFCNKFADFEL